MDAHTHAQHPLDGSIQGRPAPPQGPLDIQKPGDCLALVRHTFGRLPRESLVVIGLLNGYTGGHMRIDLTPALREPFSSARLIADCLAGEGSSPAPEAALVVLIGDGPASATQDEAWRSCLKALRIMLDSEYCVRIVQAWFVCAGHVRDPLGADPRGDALPGRRIEDLRIPTLGGLPGHTSRRESQPLDQAAVSFLERAPAADPALEVLLGEARRQHDPQSHEGRLRRRLEAWDLALCQQLDAGEHASRTAPAPREGTRARTRQELRADAARLRELLGQLHTGFDRDLLIPLATLGLDHAIIGLRHRQGVEEAPMDSAEQHMLRRYAASFLGETHSRPDWERVDALEAVLGDLVPYARAAERENLLCLMAWIEWARGRGSAAGSFIDRCLQEFPENEFSRLIERLMQLKGVCLWARVKQHSWSWARSAVPSAD
ncbi:DUF4192 domain-containing protein [Nesterenkonia sp. LB17]|uniref:DUF4192 family protein n=1 Tax=Nesterenkonia sp. LB17 TaxID=2901230 RepID=UPI001F4C68DA|nr:DUF4192 family protein [Nesterenkonia sp. LB17]MCH8565248.1 DUF4192 domain-containing protein [Nesterenkonia sp. LB17]